MRDSRDLYVTVLCVEKTFLIISAKLFNPFIFCFIKGSPFYERETIVPLFFPRISYNHTASGFHLALTPSLYAAPHCDVQTWPGTESEGRRDHYDHLGFFSGIPAWSSTVSVAKETIINLFHPSPSLCLLSILLFLATIKRILSNVLVPSSCILTSTTKKGKGRVGRIFGWEFSLKFTSCPWILCCRWTALWKWSSQLQIAYQMLYCLTNTRHIIF